MITLDPKLQNWARDFAFELGAPQGRGLLHLLHDSILRQTDPDFRETLMSLLVTVERGVPISDALADHPDTFDKTFVTIVRYGEIYGELDETLRRYADKPEEMFRPCGVKREE